jgi:gluconolactonase
MERHPEDENLRYIEEDNHVSRRFRYPAGNSNGNTFDYEGRQIACQHGTRKVVRYEHNGKTTVLAEKFENQEFNAPNDAVVHPNDGAIWFTDPGYGSLMEYEGNRLPGSATSPQPIRKEAIYRIDKSGAITKVADEPFKPNGLCFSHDYRRCMSPTPASRIIPRRTASSGPTTLRATSCATPGPSRAWR